VTPADSNAVQTIKDLEFEWVAAIEQRDAESLHRIIADDFVIAGWLPNGQLEDKQSYIEDCLRPVDVTDAVYTFDRWKIRKRSNTILVNCVFECHAKVAGREWGGTFLFTDVWMLEDVGWRVVTRHSNPIVVQEQPETSASYVEAGAKAT
jgi:ketosteroid isomerase-like protein